MALTPAQKYRQEQLAKLNAQKAQAAGGDPYGAPQGSDYELLQANLAEHRRILSNIKGNEQKAAYKTEAITDFDGWIDGVLQSGQGNADPVFMEMMVWNTDAGHYKRALDMASYALKHKLTMPDLFKRAIPEYLMDEFSTAYHKNQLGEGAVELLEQVILLTNEVDAHDQPRAKLLKAHAYALVGCKPDSQDFKAEEIDVQKAETALTEMERAFELDEKVGVKKDIEKLKAVLKKTAAE